MILLAPYPINSSPLTKKYTLDDLNSLPEPEDHSILEIINGVLYMSPLPLPSHNRIIEKIDLFLRKQLLSEKIAGIVFRPRAGIQTGNNTWLEPDLFFLSSETESRFRTTNPTTADLVVEVLSDSTREYDKKTKADTYAALKVRELWLVDPTNKTLEVRENQTGTTSWLRNVLYTWEETMESPVLGISVDLRFLED